MIKRTKGNTQSVIVPLYTHTMHEDGTISTEAYTPTANDVVTASLVGKRIYNYPTTIGDGCIYFSITGVEVADIYSLRVIVIKADGSRLRYYTEEAIELTEETTEDTEQGAEFTTSGVTLDASWFFFAQGEQGEDGADGRGITNIVLMASQGLNDTYQINYTDGTHSTFVVKNGKDGIDGSNGEDGTDGRGITSVAKTSTAGLVDTYTITYTDSTTSTFNVTNGRDGVTPDLSQYAKKVDAFQNLVANSLTADLVTLGSGEINLGTDSQDRLIYGGAVVLNEDNIIKAEGEADNLIYSMGMVDSMLPSVAQSTGQSTTAVMSQKAVTDALAGAGGGGEWELVLDYTTTEDMTGVQQFMISKPCKELYVIFDESGISGTTYSTLRAGVVVKNTDGFYVSDFTNISGAWATNRKYKVMHIEAMTDEIYRYRVASEIQLWGYATSSSFGQAYRYLQTSLLSIFYGFCTAVGTIYANTHITIYGR